MKKKKAHTMAGSNSTFNPHHTSPNLQCLIVLDYLFEHGSISSRQARHILNIYSLPIRIKELRNAGYLIDDFYTKSVGEYSTKNVTIRYVLLQKQPITKVITVSSYRRFYAIQSKVVELCIKFNQADLLRDLNYFNDEQWLGALAMLHKLNRG